MNKAPKWFLPVAVVALLWNLLGCVAFLFDLMITPEQLAQMTEAQQEMYAARPAWSVAATGVAVVFGALGCLGLILRKKWSFLLLLISLIGVIVQDLSLFVLSGAGAAAGSAAYIMQGIVLVVSILLVLLSRQGIKNQWLA